MLLHSAFDIHATEYIVFCEIIMLQHNSLLKIIYGQSARW